MRFDQCAVDGEALVREKPPPARVLDYLPEELLEDLRFQQQLPVLREGRRIKRARPVAQVQEPRTKICRRLKSMSFTRSYKHSSSRNPNP